MHLLADILSLLGSFGLLFGAYLLAQQIEREHLIAIRAELRWLLDERTESPLALFERRSQERKAASKAASE